MPRWATSWAAGSFADKGVCGVGHSRVPFDVTLGHILEIGMDRVGAGEGWGISTLLLWWAAGGVPLDESVMTGTCSLNFFYMYKADTS